MGKCICNSICIILICTNNNDHFSFTHMNYRRECRRLSLNEEFWANKLDYREYRMVFTCSNTVFFWRLRVLLNNERISTRFNSFESMSLGERGFSYLSSIHPSSTKTGLLLSSPVHGILTAQSGDIIT